MNHRLFLFVWGFVLLPLLGWGQKSEIIYLNNSSFEDIPRAGLPPSGWEDCGQPGETPPDVQPYGGFSVTRTAQDGGTYLGLVVRDNNSWESVSQKLSRPLKKGGCYNFTVFLARSGTYVSPTKKDQSRLVNFEKGCILRIWGGNSHCDKLELLAETSGTIEATEWKEYVFKFEPKTADLTYLVFEAYYKIPTLFPYNGNLLIDNAGAISSCDIPLENTIATAKTTVTEPSVKTTVTQPSVKTTVTEPSVKTTVTQPSNTTAQTEERNQGDFDPNLKAADLKVGYTFRLQKLYFPADSASITPNAERALVELYDFLKRNPTVSVEIGGHTNGLPADEYCDKLSSDRARNVATYLVKRGIEKDRVLYKGYGKRKPVTSDATPYGRQQNQRVEVKIIEIE